MAIRPMKKKVWRGMIPHIMDRLLSINSQLLHSLGGPWNFEVNVLGYDGERWPATVSEGHRDL